MLKFTPLLLLALLPDSVCSVSLPAGIPSRFGNACDPFAENSDGVCDTVGKSLMQKTAIKVKDVGTTGASPSTTGGEDAVGAAEGAVAEELPVVRPAKTPVKRISASMLQTKRPFSGPDLRLFQNTSENHTKVNQKNHLAGSTVTSDEAEAIKSKNGYFLGFSRDFWIVLAIMIVGLILSMVMVLGTVNIAVGWRSRYLGNGISLEPDGSITKPVFPVGFGQRLLGHDKNSNFAIWADLSLRCAVMCGVIALTYWVPFLEPLNNYGWSMQYVVVIICFSVYMDIGNTTSLAWYNFYGTLLPTLNVFLMWGFCPDGVTKSETFSPTWWFGMIDFVIFNGAFLVLNVPVGVRMFALSWQAYFSMAFLDPQNTTKFSTGLDDVILEGAAVGPLVGTIFGCIISILVVCLSPWGYALTGLGAAQEQAIGIAWSEGMQWKQMIKLYKGSESTIEIDRLKGEAKILEAKVHKLDSMMSATWWECFDLWKAGRVKAHITELQGKLDCMHDWLKGSIQAMQEEDFNDKHDKLMAKVGDQLETLADVGGKLMFRAVKMGINGFAMSKYAGADAALAQIEQRELKADMQAVAVAQKELAEVFASSRQEVFGANTLTPDSLGEHFFVFALSTYGQIATEYAEYILSDKRAEPQGILKSCYNGVKDTFAFNSLNFIMRTSIGFFGAWVIGYFGMPGGIMAAYSSTAAGTTAYLMAAEGKGGSAIMKNVARFQGTGGGTIIGQLLFTTLMTCAWYGGIIGFGVVVIYEFFAFYLYFSSQSFGYVGLLLAAYGAEHMIMGCSSQDTPGGVYNTIVDQTMAILCVTAGDLIIGNRSSGHLAAEALFTMTNILEGAMRDLFGIGSHDVNTPRNKRHCALIDRIADHGAAVVHSAHKIDIQSKHMQAESIGSEAPLEPRFYRMPFKQGLWDSLLKCGGHIGVNLCCIEYAITDAEARHARDKSGKHVAVDAMISTPTLGKIADDTMARWEKVFSLAETLMLHETNDKLTNLSMSCKQLLGCPMEKLDPSLPAIVEEISQALSSSISTDSILADGVSLASVLVMMMSGIIDKINIMEEVCFKDPDINLEDLSCE